MKKMTVIISIAAMLAITMFAGCQKQEAAKPAEQPAAATAPTSTPTTTVTDAAHAK